MTLITFPSTIPATTRDLRLIRGDSVLEMFGGGSVINQVVKATWFLSFALRPLKLDDARTWQAVLIQLAKLANTFQITPPGWTNGVGFSGTNPTVNGSGQLGLQLTCAGSGSTAYGLAGDFCEIPTTSGSEFKQLTADATASSGVLTIDFEPAMREAATDSGTIDFKTPKITMRFIEALASQPGRVGNFYNIVFNAVEQYGP